MSKIRIKYIMELIFIFILPLLFLLPCIKIKDNYVYDNEGNYQVSEKVVVFESPLNLTTHVIEEQNIFNGFDFVVEEYADENIYINLQKLDNEYQEMWICVNGLDLINFNGDEIYFDSYVGGINGSINLSTLAFDDIDDETKYRFITYDDQYLILVRCDYFYQELERIYHIDTFTGEGYFSIYSEDYSTINVITEEEELNLFGQIKKLIIDNLHIESSFLVDLLITYVFLWFVMFIIWHLFYLLLDFLLHFWRKEEK